ncbi:hypothetical protein KX928_04825 [Roseobacter sp. YSTF-M11]|uniref:Rhamnogalacturonase A/B/Epimerase-like pectate lyase domain-containing protein n=1 Tax=Roseobacter insulae TaxID=2859783 RepID=A0A9X1FSW9_9RHOB|nr:glycosyl hydrolase family 28-related protein [Roseobacter insulae]MBW4707105.1 hypothetical protein [Roseobacter insulae]
MNKVVTDGVQLMPIAFASALDAYSSEDGTPGSDSYSDGDGTASIVVDADFGSCLEVIKKQGTQRIRYMGETPLLPGCYLRITARVKALRGPLPAVRIAGFAGGAGGAAVGGVVTTGTAISLPAHDAVVEVSAIVGAGARPGVDMVWGPAALYGHFGLDLTGASGGVIRVDDLIIEDVTSAFLRDILATVDVRDYGAVGDGVTDDSAAFRAADAAARGRQLLVSRGTYHLAGDIALDADVRFEGTVTMPADAVLLLRRNFNLSSYSDALGDHETGFIKGVQALLTASDPRSFDLCGQTVGLTRPFAPGDPVGEGQLSPGRRIIRNGRLEARGHTAWHTRTVSMQARVSATDPQTLADVPDLVDIPLGALVTGPGVAPETYVRARNPANCELTLTAPVAPTTGSADFTFSRFQYILDFSRLRQVTGLVLQDVDLMCRGVASGIMLAPAGHAFQVRDCHFMDPRDRGVTSIGEGCHQMLLDHCQIVSGSEAEVIGLNTNAGGVRICNCFASGVQRFGVLGGANTVLMGNQTAQPGNPQDLWVFRPSDTSGTP